MKCEYLRTLLALESKNSSPLLSLETEVNLRLLNLFFESLVVSEHLEFHE